MAKEYWTPGAGWRTGSGFEMFDRLGHPGKYTMCKKLASSTTTTFTGSLYGFGAFLIEDATNVEIIDLYNTKDYDDIVSAVADERALDEAIGAVVPVFGSYL